MPTPSTWHDHYLGDPGGEHCRLSIVVLGSDGTQSTPQACQLPAQSLWPSLHTRQLPSAELHPLLLLAGHLANLERQGCTALQSRVNQ